MGLSSQISKLRNQLEYEQRKDHDGPIRKLSDTLSTLREELVRVEGRETQVKGEMEELSEQLEKFREDMVGLRSRAEGIEAEIQELKKRGSDDTSSLGNVKRQMTAKETHIEQLNARKQMILESCELDQIKLPTTRGGVVQLLKDVDIRPGQVRCSMRRVNLVWRMVPILIGLYNVVAM